VTRDEESTQSFRLLWLSRRRFFNAVRTFFGSEVGNRAKALFALLLGFIVTLNGLNVVNSYVGRDFMTAIERHNPRWFAAEAGFYVAVFAASTVVAVFYRFTEERFALLWREWLTRRLVSRYMHGSTYYSLRERGEVDNPDQRIAEDVRAFTTMTLSLTLMALNGTFTIFAFSGVLWSISPLLFAMAVAYAATGSLLTVLLGRPLIWLNCEQFDREAALRADLIHVREHGESIAIQRREDRLSVRLQQRIDALVENTKCIVAVNRNLGFFTTGYNYLIQIIPALVIAPMFMRGEVDFGVITQSAMAFSQLLGAFSLVVTQFGSISSYAAVLARLTALGEATEHTHEKSAIEILEGKAFAYERLTLTSPRDGRTLIRELSLDIREGWRLLITGPNETAKVALFRATAGLWQWGTGRISRPAHDELLFLPERPYLPPGTLRQALVRNGGSTISDEQILQTLRLLDVETVITRAGGLDVERDWDNILALGEQQLLAVASIVLARPRFVFLDRVATAFSVAQLDHALKVLCDSGVTCVLTGERGVLEHHYDAVLELALDGTWTCAAQQVSSAAGSRA
jgi:putative ATP-binding cassette transporter